MAEAIKILPQEQVVRLVAQADPREFALFLGAGASRSSGVVLASEMIAEWRATAHREQAPDEPLDAWLAAQPWYRSPHEYSELFEALYPDERARQKYVEPKIEAALPGWGYLYLAQLIRAGQFNLVFTTNFDDLVNEALTRFLGYNAVVCAADSEVGSINVSTARAKIIKLHGDYLFKRLKNTRDELSALQANMERKFAEFARQCGLLVLGYAGGDESVMGAIGKLLADAETFPSSIYWGVHDAQATRPEALDRLAREHPRALRLFRCEDFDAFMARLHDARGLQTPDPILEPLKTARETFDRLLAQTQAQPPLHATIVAHAELLGQHLGGSIAQATDAAALDLFEAQIALASRDHARALSFVERYAAAHPDDAQALTLWGAALAVRSEEEGASALVPEAMAKWRDAVRADPAWTPARYNLLRHHALRQEYREAIAEGEALMKLAPRDSLLRVNLAQLYASSGRIGEALALVDSLVEGDAENPSLHMLRAALLRQRGRPVDALAAGQRALALAPASAWVRSSVAQAYAAAARPVEAAAEFNQAIQLDPKNAGLRLQAATFFLASGQPAQAMPHLSEAARLEPESAEVRGWLATAYLQMGRIADAQREIDTAVGLDPDESRLLATAGQIEAMAGHFDVAERHFRRASAVNPHTVAPLAGLAELYLRAGKWPQMQATMQQIAQLNPQVAQQLQQHFAMLQQQGGGAMPVAEMARRVFGWLGGNNP